jgi:hypothetical protein
MKVDVAMDPGWPQILHYCELGACGPVSNDLSGKFRRSRRATGTCSIDRAVVAEAFDQGWFAPELLSKASADTLRQAVRQLVDNNGAFEGVARRGEEYFVELERALVPTVVGFDAEGRMTTLLFKRPIPRFSTINDAKSAFTALP